jgi:hypothetical protein
LLGTTPRREKWKIKKHAQRATFGAVLMEKSSLLAGSGKIQTNSSFSLLMGISFRAKSQIL